MIRNIIPGRGLVRVRFQTASNRNPADGIDSCRAGDDLETAVTVLRDRGIAFRHAIISGPGGKQIQILDPDGNPIELFEPARRS